MKNRPLALALAGVLLLSGPALDRAEAGRRGGSSGGRSFSSGRSSSFGGKSYSSGGRSFSSGKSYSSGASSRPTVRPSDGKVSSPGTTSRPGGKSYSSGAAPTTGHGGKSYSSGTAGTAVKGRTVPHGGKSYVSGGAPIAPAGVRPRGPAFDTLAAGERRRAESREVFQRGQQPAPTYRAGGKPRPIDPRDRMAESVRRRLNRDQWVNRDVRERRFYARYYLTPAPVVVYHDPYNTFFWLWLLDRDRQQRAYWAYHHRDTMDEARYRDLLHQDAALQARIKELEEKKVPRDPTWVPRGLGAALPAAAASTAGLMASSVGPGPLLAASVLYPGRPLGEPDLMYSDAYIDALYNPQPAPEPTPPGATLPRPSQAPVNPGETVVTILVVVAIVVFLVWLVFFKRWGVTEETPTRAGR